MLSPYRKIKIAFKRNINFLWVSTIKNITKNVIVCYNLIQIYLQQEAIICRENIRLSWMNHSVWKKEPKIWYQG